MKITIGQIRQLIREGLSGSQPDETYSGYLLDDPAFDESSVLVSNDIKEKIKAWAKAMKLTP